MAKSPSGRAAAETQTVTVDGRSVKLTNLGKVLYPETGTTKADVLSYYAQVAEVMLPHLYERPATRKRWPDGVSATGREGKAPTVFFNKDLGAGTPEWVARHKISHRDHDNYYPVVNDLATLTWLAQLAALEIHVPQWRFGKNGQPRNPDRLVLDLDPGEGVTLAETAEVARWARAILADIGHEPVPVTSGSKGIHLYAPLDGSLNSEQVTAVALELAKALEAEYPDKVISSMRRSDRDGKVFIDWSQNNGAKTTVSPYSLRGRDHPMVAAPRTWAELDHPDLAQLSYREVLDRVAEHGDPLARQGSEETDVSAASVDRLATYRSMRDAARTPEPVPAEPAVHDHDGRTFVIQRHEARALHHDFRLEHEGVLVSWAIPKGPPTEATINHLAVQTEDHPLEYAAFAGDIPAGEYGGGHVDIWDAGTYRLHKWRDGKEVIVTLFGRPDGGLGGVAKFALIHTGSGGGTKAARNWLIHRMETDPEDLNGPRSGGYPEPSAVAMPDDIPPMTAHPGAVTDFGDESDWAFEMKWDGVRIIASLAGGAVRLTSRSGRDETASYPDVVESLSKINCETAVLDGEIVVVDPQGRPRFGLLQNRINLTRPADIARAARAFPAQMMAFDLMHLNGRSLIKETYEVRRAMLSDLVPGDRLGRVQVPPTFEGDADAALSTSAAMELEGVVAKRRSSIYQPGRRGRTWLKLKHLRTQEVVIAGWKAGQGRRDGSVGSLFMGIPTPQGLLYVGRVGSGFDDTFLVATDALVERLADKANPLIGVPREDLRDAHWITPSEVGEVIYTELTHTGRLRHPVWRGWRRDKSPDEVTWEGPGELIMPD